MGLCESVEMKERRVQNDLSKRIEKDLAPKNEMRQKLLLLGPGESGKSTCLKQMKILHHNGFTDAEVNEKKIVVYINTLQSMAQIIHVMEEKGIPFTQKGQEEHANLIKKLHPDDVFEITSDLRKALVALWADPAVKKGFQYKNEYHITESASYFFDSLERICAKDYRPTSQDILLTRVPTTGVVQVHFRLRDINFESNSNKCGDRRDAERLRLSDLHTLMWNIRQAEVFDVGGQRSERRKWIHCFDDCNAIIFVAAISEYDQVIKEDNLTNRLIEAIELFGGIANSQYFLTCSIILFLNKKDLFEEKIKRVQLKTCFKGYGGINDYDHGVRYIRKQFEANVKNQRKPYVHETCATDTTQVTVVINSVIDTIVQENLKDTGMM